MEILPAKRSSLFQQIVRQLEESILDGTLGPGSKLPTERELAGRFEVSRTTVRQALVALQVKGLIESHIGSGTFTARGTEFAVARLAQMLVKQHGRLAEALEVRGLLEPFMARLAAERATDEDLAALEENLRSQEAAVQARQPIIELDNAFHMIIASAARNQIILQVVEVVNELVKESRALSLNAAGGTIASLDDHRQIASAIRNRKGEAAFKAMEIHVRHIEELVARGMADQHRS